MPHRLIDNGFLEKAFEDINLNPATLGEARQTIETLKNLCTQYFGWWAHTEDAVLQVRSELTRLQEQLTDCALSDEMWFHLFELVGVQWSKDETGYTATYTESRFTPLFPGAANLAGQSRKYGSPQEFLLEHIPYLTGFLYGLLYPVAD